MQAGEQGGGREVGERGVNVVEGKAGGRNEVERGNEDGKKRVG